MLKELIEKEITRMLTGEGTPCDGPCGDATYSGRMIVVLDKGFIHYGDVRVEGGKIIGENGGQIRYYNEPDGGLPRLCSHKPSDKTKLDPCKSWSAPLDRVVSTYQIQQGGI